MNQVSKSNSRPKAKSQRKKLTNAQQRTITVRNMSLANTRTYTFVRRMAASEALLVTTAAGIIASSTVGTSALASGCPDFASAAGMFQLYRVRAIEAVFMPLWKAPVWNGVSITTAPAYACVSPFYSNFGVTSLQGQLDATDMKLISGYSGGTFTTQYKGDPEAHFWTPVSGAVPSAESFGLICQGTSTASTINTPIWRVLIWYLVEFKMNS